MGGLVSGGWLLRSAMLSDIQAVGDCPMAQSKSLDQLHRRRLASVLRSRWAHFTFFQPGLAAIGLVAGLNVGEAACQPPGPLRGWQAAPPSVRRALKTLNGALVKGRGKNLLE